MFTCMCIHVGIYLYMCVLLLINLGECSFITPCSHILICGIGEFDVPLFPVFPLFVAYTLLHYVAYSKKKFFILYFSCFWLWLMVDI